MHYIVLSQKSNFIYKFVEIADIANWQAQKCYTQTFKNTVLKTLKTT